MPHPHTIFTHTMADMSYPDIQSAADDNAIVLLPMGVIEEHGPHLCLATDIYTAHIQCLAVQKLLSEQGRASIIAPPFYWGICQAARGLVGTFNIRMETAQALLYDILASLASFGFSRVFAVNAHGDVEHKIAALRAFREAAEQLGITACFPFEEALLPLFGLDKDAPHIYLVRPPEISVSHAPVPDVHAGDIETAMIHRHYPQLVDTEKAKSLPDVDLGGQFEAWMFGGQMRTLAPQGYLGSPASFDSVKIDALVQDQAARTVEAIVSRIGQDASGR